MDSRICIKIFVFKLAADKRVYNTHQKRKVD